MNDIDILRSNVNGNRPAGSFWASAAARASPVNDHKDLSAGHNLYSSTSNLDLYSSTRASPVPDYKDLHDPKRVTRSDIVSAVWPWQQQVTMGTPCESKLDIEKLGVKPPKCGLGVRLRHSNGMLSVAAVLSGGAADECGQVREVFTEVCGCNSNEIEGMNVACMCSIDFQSSRETHEEKNFQSTPRIHVKFMKKFMVSLFFNLLLFAHISLSFSPTLSHRF
jgi:hypothetical protein